MNLKGEGSFTNRDLIVVSFDNQVTKDGKTRYLDVQMNREGLVGNEKVNTNLHLSSKAVKQEDGSVRYNNSVPYHMSQYDKLKEAAGDNVIKLENGAEVFAVKASLTKGGKGGLVVNTAKEMGPSEFKVDENIFERQFKAPEAKAVEVVEKPAEEKKPARTRRPKEIATETPAVDGPELG